MASLKNSAPLKIIAFAVVLLTAASLFGPSAPRAQGSGGEAIVLAADDWPPFTSHGNEKGEGYMVDIVRETLEEAGYRVQFVIVPWKRAIEDCRAGAFYGILGATMDEAQGFVFPSEELAHDRPSFWTRADSKYSYSGVRSLAQMRLGAVAEYEYFPELDRYIAENASATGKVQLTSGDSALEQNIRKLADGRIDVIVDNDYSITAKADELGLLQKLRPAGKGGEPLMLYAAFSPAHQHSRELAELVSKGIAKMRRDGRLRAVLERYSLTDWK